MFLRWKSFAEPDGYKTDIAPRVRYIFRRPCRTDGIMGRKPGTSCRANIRCPFRTSATRDTYYHNNRNSQRNARNEWLRGEPKPAPDLIQYFVRGAAASKAHRGCQIFCKGAPQFLNRAPKNLLISSVIPMLAFQLDGGLSVK